MAKIDFILADTSYLATKGGLDELIKKAEENTFGTFVVLAPDDKTMMAEKYLLEKSKNGAFANIYIYSFSRLLSRIAPVASSQVLSKSASIMIVRKIIINNLDNLVCYKKTASTNGFAEVVFETISQLKSSGVGVSEFYDMINSVRPALKIKMQDIALIYDGYQKYIENKYFDQLDLLTVLGETAKTSEFVKNAEIYLIGYDAVTAQVMSVCSDLAMVCKKFVVTAPYMAGTANSHIADNEVFNKFKHLADKLGYNYQPKRLKSNLSKTFEHIKSNLYSYPPKVMLGTNNVELLSAPTIFDEIEFVAQKICELVKGGTRFNEIALVVNGIESYQEKISQVFDEYNFSYFISKPYDYSLHPLFQLVKNYLEIARKNCEKSTVLAFLSNILLQNAEIMPDFINYVEEFGINYNAFKKPFTKFNPKTLSEENFKKIENVRAELADYLLLFSESDGSTRGYNKIIEKFFDKINIEERLSLLENIQQDDREQAAVTMQVKNKFDQVKSELEMFLGEENVSLEIYENLLTTGLTSSDISLVPISQDAISISHSCDGMSDIKHLFVLGASEGMFPTKQQDCGIILDSEINELGEQSKKTIEPTIKTINRRERYRAYETMLFATDSVTLSYSEGSGEEANKQSNIYNQLINMFGGANYLKIQKYGGEFSFDKQNLKEEVNKKLATAQKAIKYVCKEVGNNLRYGKFEDSMLTNAAYLASRDKMPQNVRTHLENINQKENYVLSNAEGLFFLSNKTSTSQLETYFNCPFLYFANYGLRLRDNPTSRMQAMDVGDILHKVAELFMQKIAKNSNLSVQNTAKSIIDWIISNKYVAEDNKLLTKIIVDEAVRLCERLYSEFMHSHYKPIGLEESFGEGKRYKPVKLTDRISLEGKIDRIDAYDGKFRIIDYKTGKIEDNIKTIFFGKKIQLVTYLLAMSDSGLKPACVVYFPIRNEFDEEDGRAGRMRGLYLFDTKTMLDMDTTLSKDNLVSSVIDVRLNKPKTDELQVQKNRSKNQLTEKQFEDIKNYCARLAKTAINEILSGYVMPSPLRLKDGDELECKYCKFNGVCGVQKTKFANGRKCYAKVEIEDISKIGGND